MVSRSSLDTVGENGENIWAEGDMAGMMLDESGGDNGRCGGGVEAVGVPHSDDAGDRTGDEFLGEYCPAWSEVAGVAADAGLFSTSWRSDDRNVGSALR